ncbi:MAG: NTP transferase domain-containing protein [Candidatus Dormibacteraeota bacterium]|nr:NTP transferase domain-containing protein [Candidatus Dormibacteraeota bacterium]MBV9524413.1 NTP transferase domain-containing protein [Candidatus Dormibacteraeota bacterium]
MADGASLPVVIPAAGLGSRFLPLTRVMPKELLPLGGWPLIHHALLEVDRAGLRDVVVVISPRKGAIRSYFEGDPVLERDLEARGDLRALERLRGARRLLSRLTLNFVEKETRGPGEAVLLAQRFTGADVMGVLLPDDVVPSSGHWDELRALQAATGAGILSVRSFPPDDAGRFGVAVCEREAQHMRVRRLAEKPAWGSLESAYRIFGRYVVTSPVLDALEAQLRHADHGEVQLTDGYAACLDTAPGIAAVEFEADFYDCGTPVEYAKALARYASGDGSVTSLEPVRVQS